MRAIRIGSLTSVAVLVLATFATPAEALSFFDVVAGPMVTGAGTFAPDGTGAYAGVGAGASVWFGANGLVGLEGGYLTFPDAWHVRGQCSAGYWWFSLGASASGTFGTDRAGVFALGPEAAFHIPLPHAWPRRAGTKNDVLSIFVRYDAPLNADGRSAAPMAQVGLRFLVDLFFPDD